jgi:aryl-alcohol dehydrogenase-like predicted oxidoreductase
MRERKLGSQGPELSVIGFGAWEAGGGSEWGPRPPEDQVLNAIRSVFDCGIDWIDTAEVYGRGRSEELVGKAAAGRRDEVRLASKVAPAPAGSGFRADQVRAACEGSLRRLSTEHLDLYQLHWPDDGRTPVEETWTAMAGLVDDGLVRFIGVSNFDQELIERCEAIRHVDSLQQEFSMLELRDRELIRWCGEQGTGVLSYSPLAFGLLTGAIGPDTRFAGNDVRAGRDEGSLFAPGNRERNHAVVEALRSVAERLGITLAQLALAWNVCQPGVTGAIAGSRNPDHVRSNAAAGDIVVDEATLDELDAIVSGAAAR